MAIVNGQMLYLYDAKLTNPNGDPDEENRPRMDYERDINLVSDLRIKRYIRDYLLDKGYELYVQKIDGEPVTAQTRVEPFSKKEEDLVQAALKAFIDIRMFGATIPVKKDNQAITGPVQFNWGYSLNTVKLLESSITSTFASKTGNKQGAIGKDYRILYSLLAFSGVISGKRADYTGLSESDLALLDEAMVKAIPLLATRSKIGQQPRLYLRLEFKDSETVLKDLRNYIRLDTNLESIRDISEYKLDVSKLKQYLSACSDKISKILYFSDTDLQLMYDGQPIHIEECLEGLTAVELG
ncbi:hypothetical protein P22_4016 [Propionispora sp. 2/2-37]|uniref:type I-B CRISPR-associated protein Cas7/Csh2 n=1 Tax=Propionispora sp. 2/2-37 TaxID=1677858 RepID=UPI0006BB6309|nr:type I-B CRISPR-associated protein Cas7/Csh2 [Propionispora sp. 2/2-37]CUH97868.1 hypothetical protein P22_4016 [Propionispora sp. 2/2-37]